MRGLLVVLALCGCGRRGRVAADAAASQRLNLGATAVNPEVHVNPVGDAGALQVQIGNVNVRLPGEAERAPAAAE